MYHYIVGTRTELWSKYGDSGDEWFQAVVTFTPHLSYHLMFEGQVGSDHSSDAALDDIDICLTDIEPGKNIIKNLVRIFFCIELLVTLPPLPVHDGLFIFTSGCFFFKKILGRHKSFSCFGLLVMSALGFKARVDPSLAFFLMCMQWIPQIHPWCDTC